MSLFELMGHYLLHKNWRARLAMNGAASAIWMLWVLSAGSLIAGSALLLRIGPGLEFFGCLALAVALFGSSYVFLPEARRLHEIKRVMNNPILFGESTHEV